MTEPTHRTIRSFVLRKGRLTVAQQHALDELWPHYGIERRETLLDFDDHFDRPAEVIVEIGFGNGESTWRMAQQEPGKNFIGIEVHKPGVGQLLMALEEHEIENVRIAREDAVPFLKNRIAERSLAGVRIYFADPWPKKRHHKRRIIQPEFVGQLADVLPRAVFCTWRPIGNLMRNTYWRSCNPARISSTFHPPVTIAKLPTGGRVPSTRNVVNDSVMK